MIVLKKITSIMLICVIVSTLFFSGCGKMNKDEKTNGESETAAENAVEEKEYFKMQTSIAYSSGDTKNWTYGNQRKEFPNNESCYVRIGVTAITTGSFGKGDGEEITVTYRFTGTENCPVQVSDGKVTAVNTGDVNVMEFSHTTTAAKEKNATEDILIFRYSPKDAESVVLEVIYDDQVAEKYDELNTIYFNN